ncbi:hypothetical protein PILCRDRAFT_749098 [Piloderma croceum F 1598]|uniref:Uncharacterized protein n=1 Tax=Piloderma croceum (strain F 1598) TaxID=765440 RepID=A0A0C3EVF3_PILCF|nr:hypothetical protein PILCRDRAFT_749098 [Piloderma croceum F 1598]
MFTFAVFSGEFFTVLFLTDEVNYHVGFIATMYIPISISNGYRPRGVPEKNALLLFDTRYNGSIPIRGVQKNKLRAGHEQMNHRHRCLIIYT